MCLEVRKLLHDCNALAKSDRVNGTTAGGLTSFVISAPSFSTGFIVLPEARIESRFSLVDDPVFTIVL
jgi:hypothetical protein